MSEKLILFILLVVYLARPKKPDEIQISDEMDSGCSRKFLYEWLPFLCIWVFVNAHFCANDFPYSLYMGFRHAHFCSNDFPYSFGFFHVRNAFQRVNSMVQWQIINDIIMYIGFDYVCNAVQRVNSMVQWRIINDIIMYIGFDHVHNALQRMNSVVQLNEL